MRKIKIIKNKRRGIALVTVLVIIAVLFIASSATLYLVTQSVKISSSQIRYEGTFQAAEGGIDIGIEKVLTSYNEGSPLSSWSGTLGSYSVNVNPEFLFVMPMTGGSILFAEGYAGIGQSAAKGGAALFYRITSSATSRTGRTGLEVIYRKVVGTQQ